jgi:CysZ protein
MPILNLATPLFAAAMMVHLHKTISSRDPGFAGGSEDKTPGR